MNLAFMGQSVLRIAAVMMQAGDGLGLKIRIVQAAVIATARASTTDALLMLHNALIIASQLDRLFAVKKAVL